MITQDVPYSYEGVALKGFLAHDPALPTPRPGVLVVHDAGGLGENIKANDENLTLKEAALESGYVDEKRFDELVDPSKMVGHGVAGA
jgi:hypothetical protein